jgi:hypothetical protein
MTLLSDLRVVALSTIGWLMAGGLLTVAIINASVTDRTDWLVVWSCGWVLGCATAGALASHNLAALVEQRVAYCAAYYAAATTAIQVGNHWPPEESPPLTASQMGSPEWTDATPSVAPPPRG